MTFVQLRQFAVLSKLGSFVKAAAQLNITQPALSRSIKALEDELGQLLFDRVGKRIELTAFGQQTLQRANALLEEGALLKASGNKADARSIGRLRLGLSSGPGVMLTAPVLRHFAKHFPRVQVDITRANTESLAHMLRDREVDALVVDVRSLHPSPDLLMGEVHELNGAFMCRPGHPLLTLAASKSLSLGQVLAYPVASNPLSDEVGRLLVERYGQQAHPQKMVRLTSDEISHLVDVTQNTDTVLLAIRAAGPQLIELKLTPAFNTKARFAMITMANRAESMYLDAVRDLMRETFQTQENK
jgi:DNA-binding transcriptional LysR family regulator